MQATTPSPLPLENPGSVWARFTGSPRFAPVLLAGLLVWEFCTLLLKASRTRLWFDELFTFHLSGLQPFAVLWSALQAGADGLPAGYYAIVQLSRTLPADPHITLRLPSVLGYLLTLLSVYLFAGRRLPAIAGLAAVLLITLTPFRDFATEARPYALPTGLLALAAVLWQRIGEKRFITACFAVALAAAVACHALIVVALSCFGVAELTRTVQSRRFRWGVWASCLIATTPFFLGLPAMLHFRAVYGAHFWAKPVWGSALWTYGSYFGLSIVAALVVVAFLTITVGDALPRMFRRDELPRLSCDFQLAEVVLIGALTLFPALLVVLTRLMGSGFTARYGWPVIIGAALGSVYLLGSVWYQRCGFHLLAALLLGFGVQAKVESAKLPVAGSIHEDLRWSRLAELSRFRSDLPVVIGNGGRSLEAAWYAPPDLRLRLVQVVDPDMAVRLAGTDTNDQANRTLSRYVPLRIEERVPFLAANRRFLLWSDGDRTDWITVDLLNDKARLTLLSTQDGVSVYLVER